MHRRHLGSLFMLGAVVAALAACADQQPAVNRVEAYALPKSLFAGEWYFGQTVVDVPGSNTVTMVGNTNYKGTYRIRWDLQENYLYARKSYEEIENAKTPNSQAGNYKGTIVGAWAISSHFDIKREYNPTTGEEMNVIGENSSDCKWYDCKYMRVDWSKNLATDYMFLDSEELFKKDAMPFYEQDANDPRWRPIFDSKNGYIDVTTSIVITPATFTYYGFTYPLCWWEDNRECTPEIIKIRNSFWRRDPNRDFEPRQHGGPYDEWFGFFVTDHLVWENHYNITVKTKKKLINRHNIWEKHHSETVCTKDADCASVAGSRCDLLQKFHNSDVAADSDNDGLPDSFETAAGLNPNSADSNGNGVTDGNEDNLSFVADGNRLDPAGNGNRDLEDFYAWDAANMSNRCTIPMAQREPVPIAYFNTGAFPRSLVCDEDATDPTKDKNTGPCEKWEFKGPAARKTSTPGISTLHKISQDYDETWFKVFLRGAFDWSHADYQKWIDTHDASKFSEAQQQILAKFGDPDNGYYAFTICPNKPVVEHDPWPCRFPHMTFAQAKAMMDQGRKFGMVDAAGKEQAPYCRHGDLRFSNVNFVKDYYDGMALLGLGPSMTDPVTGENLAGVANVYVLNDWAATNVQEMVQLLNGQITPKDFINGVNLDAWLKKINGYPGSADEGNLGFKSHSPADVSAMYDSMQQPWKKKVTKAGSAEVMFPQLQRDDAGNPLSSRQFKARLLGLMQQRGLFNPARKKVDPSIVAGTPLEQKLIDSEVLMASGINPSTAKTLTPDILNRASDVRGGFLRRAEAIDSFRRDLMHKRQMDFMQMADDAMVGLAKRLKNDKTEVVWAKARDIIMRAVLTHEMGHTMGLHHNWGGSEDVVNFHDDYWTLRTNNFADTTVCNKNTAVGVCPFSLKPMSELMKYGDPAKGLNSLYEYAYSSIMDYAGKYTIDGNGLGKYDKAALLYGHADKVEVFVDAGTVPKEAGRNVFDEWFTSNGSPLMFPKPTYTPSSYHYTNWFGQMGKKVFEETNRKIVDFRDVKQVTDAAGDIAGWFYKDAKTGTTFPRVPYVFCTYTKGDISDGCNTRDFGSDQYEKMKGHIDNWDTWYILRAFTRYEYGLSPEGYVQRQYKRSYGRLKNFNDSYALYQGLLAQWFDAGTAKTFFEDPVNGWGTYTVAMHDAFNMAMRTIAMPDIKQFENRVMPDGQNIFAEAEYKVHFRSDITNARYFTTSWYDTNNQDTCGLQWWECLHHMGFYLDKIMSIATLVNAQTYFVARDTAEDIREWRISFFDNFATQLVDFFGGMLAEEYDRVAPWVDPTKPADQTVTIADPDQVGKKGLQVTWNNQLAWRDYATAKLDPTKPTGGAALEAATRFTLQIYAAVYGMFGFQDNFDNDFIERGRIWKKGKGTGWVIKPSAKVDGVTEFDDPFTGTTYQGVAYKDARGISQRMIAHANALKSRSSVYCNQTAGLPDSCATVKDENADTALYNYRQLMDIMVQITTMYDTQVGNWSWDPFDP